MVGFYVDIPSKALRFGDVVRGFTAATPTIDKPSVSVIQDYSLKIINPSYLAILSPCCSISDKMISLAPLVLIPGKLFRNPYFSEDLTNINREMEPQQSVSEDIWNQLGNEEKEKRLASGKGYAFTDYFIYDKHDLLSKYPIHRKEGNIELNSYMIDFRQIFQVSCSSVLSPSDSPLDAKYLELSIQARQELRDKIAKYFSRVPLEDQEAITA